MSIELNSPAGQMTIDDHGRISFERAGRIVIQSAPAPTFALVYGVERPRRLDQYPAPQETLPLFELADHDGG